MEIEDKTGEKPEDEKSNDLIIPDQKVQGPEVDKTLNNNSQEMPDESPGVSQSELGQLLSDFFQRISKIVLLRKIIRNVLIISLVFAILLFIFSWFIYIIPGLQEMGRNRKQEISTSSEVRNDPAYKKLILQIGKDTQKLTRKFTAYTPGQSYLVINTTDNRFFLYRNKKQVRDGYCSTGSYTRLTSMEGSRHWIFKTPKGRFWIQQKITSPLWVRPDWSFVEEGLPIPPPNDESRYEYGVLGDYAMSLGDGYLIHGTLYKRFLGMPVTHGCVRLNDEDLETIYNTLNIGSKVFIF